MLCRSSKVYQTYTHDLPCSKIRLLFQLSVSVENLRKGEFANGTAITRLLCIQCRNTILLSLSSRLAAFSRRRHWTAGQGAEAGQLGWGQHMHTFGMPVHRACTDSKSEVVSFLGEWSRITSQKSKTYKFFPPGIPLYNKWLISSKIWFFFSIIPPFVQLDSLS